MLLPAAVLCAPHAYPIHQSKLFLLPQACHVTEQASMAPVGLGDGTNGLAMDSMDFAGTFSG